MKIEIKITKEVLKRSMFCTGERVGENCAIAIAIREICPNAWVSLNTLYFDQSCTGSTGIPNEATVFIRKFDKLKKTPEKRLSLPEFSFEIDVPDEVIERIGIQEAKAILEKSETLSLVD